MTASGASPASASELQLQQKLSFLPAIVAVLGVGPNCKLHSAAAAVVFLSLLRLPPDRAAAGPYRADMGCDASWLARTGERPDSSLLLLPVPLVLVL